MKKSRKCPVRRFFSKFRKIHAQTPAVESLFNRVVGRRCFHVNSAKFLKHFWTRSCSFGFGCVITDKICWNKFLTYHRIILLLFTSDNIKRENNNFKKMQLLYSDLFSTPRKTCSLHTTHFSFLSYYELSPYKASMFK